MNAEVFSEWLRRQGYRVIRTESSYWYNAWPQVYQAFPYHWVIQPSEEEINHLMWRQHAVGLRYSTPVNHDIGKLSYHAVYDRPVYAVENLDRRSRQNIHAGLQNCTVEPVPFQRLVEEGWELEADTATRQGRKPSMTQAAWQRRYQAAGELPGFEAWGALVDGRLAASLLTFQMGDCCQYLSQQCCHDFLCLRVNNALTYVVTHEMTGRPGIRSVFYTLQSLNAPPSVDEFKFRMGFNAKPLRQRVAFHPLLSPFVGNYALNAIHKLTQRATGNLILAKIEGILRFYLEGRRSVEQQDWPECLVALKPEIMKAQIPVLPVEPVMTEPVNI
jgi:hypothetical protein